MVLLIMFVLMLILTIGFYAFRGFFFVITVAMDAVLIVALIKEPLKELIPRWSEPGAEKLWLIISLAIIIALYYVLALYIARSFPVVGTIWNVAVSFFSAMLVYTLAVDMVSSILNVPLESSYFFAQIKLIKQPVFNAILNWIGAIICWILISVNRGVKLNLPLFTSIPTTNTEL